ncbi:hypothetical protein NA56DRAFT_56083 [Hyaloscypha hepaticicola]|uniref:Uncharacterized protein n=1 Tax=Hyaloscypha hepaticicola TaxID=2082293 RepID=A0A2J6QCH7_9HELO|nr:hypothetical protein NA56DRAFT_56083 [Hyaloscypha hepaticicola]
MILDDCSMSTSDNTNLGSLLFECTHSHRLLESIWLCINVQTSIPLLNGDSGEMAQDQGFRLPYHPQRLRDASNPNYYFEPQGSQRDTPVIKKEPLGHFYTPTPASAYEYTRKTAYGNEADLFPHLRPQQQPIGNHIVARNPQLKQAADTSGDSPPLFLARAREHVTDS